ncbi:MAG TPA: hypothetical protein GX511_02225 [Firmicutes bacterium]|nr:hypothetical protein [Bacillota bacterium]
MVSDSQQTSIGPFYGLLPELAWSPVGDRLAVYGEAEGYGIWVWEKETGRVQRLVQLLDRSGQGATTVTFVGWDPAGKALYYAIDGVQPAGPHLGERGVAVHRVGLDRSDTEVAFLPGGAALIRTHQFNAATGWLLVHRGNDLWRVNVENGRVIHLKDNLPTWDGLFGVTPSPTGETVAYPETRPGQHGLVLLNVVTGVERNVGRPDEYAFAPVWSPDGEKLAFLSAEARGETFDFQLGEDGPLPPATRLVLVTKAGEPLAVWTPPQGEKAGAPAWSLDGGRVAFLSAALSPQPDGGEAVRWRRLLVGVPGRSLTDWGSVQGEWVTVAGFAPDGRILVYRYEASGGVSILAYGLEPGQVEKYIDNAVDEPPTWWEGNLLTARLEAGAQETLNTQIYRRQPGGKTIRLTTGPGWKSRFSLAGSLLAFLNADNQAAPYPIMVGIRSLP